MSTEATDRPAAEVFGERVRALLGEEVDVGLGVDPSPRGDVVGLGVRVPDFDRLLELAERGAGFDDPGWPFELVERDEVARLRAVLDAAEGYLNTSDGFDHRHLEADRAALAAAVAKLR